MVYRDFIVTANFNKNGGFAEGFYFVGVPDGI